MGSPTFTQASALSRGPQANVHRGVPCVILFVMVCALASTGCDFLLMSPSKRGGGPDGGPVGSTAMTRLTHERLFPIVTGAHGNSDCNGCHGGFASFKQFSCISCHDHAQPATDSLHTGIAGYKYDSASCLSCHPQGVAGDVTRADHKLFFPIDVGTPHASGQCTDCHSDPADKKVFTCSTANCHVQAVTATAHAGVAGYKYDSASCLSCHPQGVAGSLPRPDHARFIPIDVGTRHADTQCADCHSNPADRKVFTCSTAACHTPTKTAPIHTGVSGFVYNPTTCLTCHPAGAPATLPRPDHARFIPIDVGTSHANAQCADCHTSPGDRSVFTCLTACHAQAPTATQHSGVAVYAYNSSQCLVCHPAGKPSLSRTEHRPFINITSGDHGGLACRSCHKTADYKVSTCLDCHNSNNP